MRLEMIKKKHVLIAACTLDAPTLSPLPPARPSLPRSLTSMPTDQPRCRPAGKKYKKLNWLKAGILTADKLVTVSPNYATEITAGPDKGVELDKIMK